MLIVQEVYLLDACGDCARRRKHSLGAIVSAAFQPSKVAGSYHVWRGRSGANMMMIGALPSEKYTDSFGVPVGKIAAAQTGRHSFVLLERCAHLEVEFGGRRDRSTLRTAGSEPRRDSVAHGGGDDEGAAGRREVGKATSRLGVCEGLWRRDGRNGEADTMRLSRDVPKSAECA